MPWRIHAKIAYSELMAEDSFYALFGIEDHEFRFTGDDARIVFFFGIVENQIHIMLRDRNTAHLLIPDEAKGAIGSDVSVDQMLYCS